MSADLVLRARLRQGWRSRPPRRRPGGCSRRVAAGVAYAVARYGLGHPYPFFAPVAAWLALGFTADRNLRRVAELAIGVAVGVLAGDLLVHLIGVGPGQVALVLAAAVLVARFARPGRPADRPGRCAGHGRGRAAGDGTGGADRAAGSTRWSAARSRSPSRRSPRRTPAAGHARVAEEAMAEIAAVLAGLADGPAHRVARSACVRRCSEGGPRSRCSTCGAPPR